MVQSGLPPYQFTSVLLRSLSSFAGKSCDPKIYKRTYSGNPNIYLIQPYKWGKLPISRNLLFLFAYFKFVDNSLALLFLFQRELKNAKHYLILKMYSTNRPIKPLMTNSISSSFITLRGWPGKPAVSCLQNIAKALAGVKTCFPKYMHHQWPQRMKCEERSKTYYQV